MEIKIDAQTLRRAQIIQSTDETRAYICGILITPSEVVSTDGTMLYYCNGGKRDGLPEGGLIIKIHGKVPKNATNAVIEIDGKRGTLHTSTARGQTKLFPITIIDLTFPNWQQIMPTPADSPIEFGFVGFGASILKRAAEVFEVSRLVPVQHGDPALSPWVFENVHGEDKLIAMPTRVD
jgi:hypothetical protein